MLSWYSVSDERVTGEGLLVIIEISEEGVYEATVVVVVAAVVVAAVVVAVVVVAAVVVAAVVVAAVVVAMVVVAAVVVAMVVVAAVVVTAEVATAAADSRLLARVVVVADTSKWTVMLSPTTLSLIELNVILVVGCWL